MIESDAKLAGYVRVVVGPSDHALAWLYRNCCSRLIELYRRLGLAVGESLGLGGCVSHRAPVQCPKFAAT